MKLKALRPTLRTVQPTVRTLGESWRTSGMTTAQRGYGYRWQKARERFLRINPLCVYCERAGRVEIAGVVDHKTPHRGDPELFWNESNWQSLCKPCHDGAKAREERGSPTPHRISADGWLIDPVAGADGLPPGGQVGHQKDRSF
jgi:5-methylcytosine-specific restriction protein A